MQNVPQLTNQPHKQAKSLQSRFIHWHLPLLPTLCNFNPITNIMLHYATEVLEKLFPEHYRYIKCVVFNIRPASDKLVKFNLARQDDKSPVYGNWLEEVFKLHCMWWSGENVNSALGYCPVYLSVRKWLLVLGFRVLMARMLLFIALIDKGSCLLVSEKKLVSTRSM